VSDVQAIGILIGINKPLAESGMKSRRCDLTRGFIMRRPAIIGACRLATTSSIIMLLASAAQAQEASDVDRYYGPHMMWCGGGGYGMIFGPLFMIMGLAAVIALVVLLARRAGGPLNGPYATLPTPRTALDILKERFARGEIDKDEYEERRRILGG
jgi:putative membrane protein